MTVTLNGTNGVTFNDGSAQSTAATGFGFKNRIINGAMMIDQRNAGASVTPAFDATYTLDRWMARLTAASKYSVQRNAGSVTPPVGFTNYLGVTSLAATSVAAGDYYVVQQTIEGLNVADLGWGASGAQTVTLSFWVRSSLTGTFGGCVGNAAFNRSYPFSYSINAANTWEQKTITISGDTTGTWLKDNGSGLCLYFGLGVGSTYSGTAGAWSGAGLISVTGATSVVGTNGATFYITGVQLEKGSTATSFDYRPYGTELALCQRYYEKSYNMDTIPATATAADSLRSQRCAAALTDFFLGCFLTPKRTTPTIVIYSTATGASGNVYGSNGADKAASVSSAGEMRYTVSAAMASSELATWHHTASAEL